MATCIGPESFVISKSHHFIAAAKGPNLKAPVAISQGVPIVALYGPSNPFFYGPYQAKSIVLESMDHYEIGKSMKQVIKEGKYKGISVITEEQVIKAAETLLQES